MPAFRRRQDLVGQVAVLSRSYLEVALYTTRLPHIPSVTSYVHTVHGYIPTCNRLYCLVLLTSW